MELLTAFAWKVGDDDPHGANRYKGVVINGKWQINESFPELDADTLRAGLALANEIRSGSVKARDSAEAEAVKKFCMKDFSYQFDDNKIVVINDTLTLSPPNNRVFRSVGGVVFLKRYAKVWPNFLDEEDEDDNDDLISILTKSKE